MGVFGIFGFLGFINFLIWLTVAASACIMFDLFDARDLIRTGLEAMLVGVDYLANLGDGIMEVSEVVKETAQEHDLKMPELQK